MRNEMDSVSKRMASNSERLVEQKARDVLAKVTEEVDASNRRCDTVKEGASVALHEATTILRKSVTDVRASVGAEVQSLGQLIQGIEERIGQATVEAEKRALEASTRRLHETAGDLRKDISEAKQALYDSDEINRQRARAELDQALAQLERTVEEKASASMTASSALLSQGVSQIQSELAEALKVSNAKADEYRCQAAEALSKEVQARQEAVTSAGAASEALVASARSDAAKAVEEAIARAIALSAQVDRRVDMSNDSIKNVEERLEAYSKEGANAVAAVRNELRTDRQRTEEGATQAAKVSQEIRDSLESQLQNEAAELRTGIADARKKIYEEANALRAELREQPSKRELVELASTTTEQYSELTSALDLHRSRLEGAVADYGTKVREARGEATEARLRMQRETLALGAELTTLRTASSSLANGVMKTLHVLGFLREEAEGQPVESADGKKDHHRGLEIEDLLEWEKVGKSLATRVARQWYLKESAGIPSMLSMVERKADVEELAALKKGAREAPAVPRLNETGSTMVPHSPASPKPSDSPPDGVSKVREQRMVTT